MLKSRKMKRITIALAALAAALLTPSCRREAPSGTDAFRKPFSCTG